MQEKAKKCQNDLIDKLQRMIIYNTVTLVNGGSSYTSAPTVIRVTNNNGSITATETTIRNYNCEWRF